MTKSKVFIATVIGTITLFVFGGIFQAIPFFGIGSVQNIQTSNITIDKFDETINEMSYVTTKQSVSFIATKPINYYNLTKFFIVELISVFFSSLILALAFSKMGQTKLSERLTLTLAFALLCTFATHIPYFNWWGFSSQYTVGVTLRTILGWILVAYIQNRFIYKIK